MRLQSKKNTILLALLLRHRRNKRLRKLQPRRPRRFWMKEIYKRRERQGAYNNLIQEMRLSDQESFFNFYRMTPQMFDNLLSIVGPAINHSAVYVRKPLSAAEKLSLTLR